MCIERIKMDNINNYNNVKNLLKISSIMIDTIIEIDRLV